MNWVAASNRGRGVRLGAGPRPKPGPAARGVRLR